MADPVVIDKNRPLLSSQDYFFLREKGLEYIRSLSGKIWSDHNLHDPGVTTLEALCYALTDLGYRTSFDIKDVMAAGGGSALPADTTGLFPPHEVLTNTPLTISDYRRLLLMLEGVRNAWLDPLTDSSTPETYQASEIPIYADVPASRLVYDATDGLGNANDRVHVSGLYKVLLELEIDDVLGSLNHTFLRYQVLAGPLQGVILSIDGHDPEFVEGKLDFSGQLTSVSNVVVAAVEHHFRAQATLAADDAHTITLSQLQIHVVNALPRPLENPVEVNAADLTDLLSASVAADSKHILRPWWDKQQRRQDILSATRCVLNAHRNLCEDVLDVQTVKPDLIAMCADIELRSDADIERVQAQVFHAIETYLNPPIRYYALRELLEEGLAADHIYDGPFIDPQFTCHGKVVFTKPGFVKTSELASSELRKVVYTSDIINILMEMDEIISVQGVLLQRYDDDGNPSGAAEKWCLSVTPGHQPVLFIERSKLLFFKNHIPYRAQASESQRTLDHLRGMARRQAYVAPGETLPIPTGADRALTEFFSVQEDFPQTYGIGQAGLPIRVTATRVAQARQLKAYLTFFDQVLADYLAQLAHVRELFSLDETLKQTYFSQHLADIPGVRQDFVSEFYVDPTQLGDPQVRTRLTEDEELFLDRRNRALDHLGARFAEQFTDYVLMMFTLDGDRVRTGQAVIDDKIDFLREYPVVSRERHKAFNYRPESANEIWNTNNVSGLEKRVSRLLGIDSYLRRDLACTALLEEFFTTRAVSSMARLEVQDGQGSVLFSSTNIFPDAATALQEASKILPFIRLEKSYVIDTSSGPGQVFYTIEAAGVALRNQVLFDTEADAVQNIRAMIDRYDQVLQTSPSCNNEGFHLIEHILLRPFTTQDRLMQVCLAPDGSCGDEDPYSFRISVAVPYWPPRFRNLNLRRLFERTLREEAPAHIHVRICWIDNRQMAELDRKFRAWLNAKASPAVDQNLLTNTAAELIDILERLKTIYPAATLHDCVEGADENPVLLDSTNLGIF